MAKTTRIHDIEKAIYEGKINTPFAAVPHTTIKNEQGQPRRMADLTQNLKVHKGTERIHIKSIRKLDGEFGPNGETVYENQNKDSRIRIVGDWRTISTTYGTRIDSNGVTNIFVEVTFYGTGLNMLYPPTGLTPDLRVTIDGGTEGGDILTEPTVTTIGNRNYETNQVTNIVKDLSLDWHTVKLRVNTSDFVDIYGFEILNKGTQLAINAGQPYQGGLAAKLDVQTLMDYKPSAFTSLYGGRVITYIDEKGNLGQAYTAIDDTLGAEVLPNGDFDTDLSGWVDASTGASTVAWSATNGGSLLLTNSGSGGENPAITRDIPTVIGESYELRITSPSGGSAVNQKVEMRFGNQTAQVKSSSSETLKKTFVATASTTTIRITTGSSLVAGTSFADVASVKVSSVKFLEGTNHINEESYKTINFRDFGRNRADDFSTLTGAASDRAFTLNDGTTTLVGESPSVQPTFGTVELTADNYFLTFTFVGTGLDIVRQDSANGGSDNYQVSVNGSSAGSLDGAGSTAKRTTKICSGLPYGSHTVKILRITAATWALGVHDFIVYQPKKPALPENVIELADYNIVSEFFATGNSGNDRISQGIIRKSSDREGIYIGSWAFGGVSTSQVCGQNIESTVSGDSVEYTFEGTGFEFNSVTNPVFSSSATITINGNADLSAYTSSSTGGIVIDSISPFTFSSDNGGGTEQSSVSVRDLPYGTYKVKITDTSGVQMHSNGFDIITHIHTPNTEVGSLSMKDLRHNATIEGSAKGKVDLGKAKAWAHIDSLNNEVLESYNIAAYLKESVGTHHLYLSHPFKTKEGVIAQITNSDSTQRTIFYEAISPSYIQILSRSNGGGADDPGQFTITFHGELENEEDLDLEDL